MNYSGKNDFNFEVNQVSQLQQLYSPADFDINIYDLRDSELWKNSGKEPNKVNITPDLKRIYNMVNEAESSEHIFLLPRDLNFKYRYEFQGNNKTYRSRIRLKDIIGLFNEILNDLIPVKIDVKYERTSYKFNEDEVQADFIFIKKTSNKITFDEADYDDILFTKKSRKMVGIKKENISVLTLDIKNNLQLEKIFKHLSIIPSYEANKPEWFNTISKFDDEDLINSLSDNKLKIDELESNRDRLLNKLDENNRFKSILYLNGEVLVEIVIDILKKLFEENFDDFVDIKNEDYLFKYSRSYFIFEIKGVATNVKITHLTQLEHHSMHFLERSEHEQHDIDLNKILIINHQKGKNPSDREPVNNNVIKDARNKYGILILETTLLLDLLEKKKRNEVNLIQIIDLFKSTGLAEI